jgi:hypothetical protein
MAQITMSRRDRFSTGAGSLLRRTQQWLKARERLLSAWYARTQTRSGRRRSERGHRIGSSEAIHVPYWWEYESPLKRLLALEAMMLRMFAIVPVRVTV